ncbi:MAG TPA: bifunctional phosphoribosyl-AMP cyclohydrolase/phosphoribosyl-ATP diphosphatase HisIE [Bacteroidia bacterium]|jgi:phosphoribosyl-ATP pyrophosphohydrolase/phosphoribosyl-AMP cyclohydrolase|nr:bifunctional phosphoribosyl-AMP cyclohydrolase/phosphoribosyl-ATP diphosphatase HisIE [Bacteroidia bacterium]
MNIGFKKFENGLAPAVIQDSRTGKVLMLGYMNQEALTKTEKEKRVTFYSRSKQRLWTKGEESGNFLNVQDILADCDNDAILIKAIPEGPVCHTGADTCWNEKNESNDFLAHLERIIQKRKNEPSEKSYTSTLFKAGINKVAQKVGEEATELIIEAKDNNEELFLNEAADLLFHYLVLLAAKNTNLDAVTNILKQRHK